MFILLDKCDFGINGLVKIINHDPEQRVTQVYILEQECDICLSWCNMTDVAIYHPCHHCACIDCYKKLTQQITGDNTVSCHQCRKAIDQIIMLSLPPIQPLDTSFLSRSKIGNQLSVDVLSQLIYLEHMDTCIPIFINRYRLLTAANLSISFSCGT